MFNLHKYKIFDLDGCGELYLPKSDSDFNVTKYIYDKYKTAPSCLYLDDQFNESVLDYLFENGKLLRYSVNSNISPLFSDVRNFKTGTFWFKYKDVYIRLNTSRDDDDVDDVFLDIPIQFSRSKKSQKYKTKTFSIWIFSPTSVQKYPIEDFNKFLIKSNDCRIHLFIKNEYNEYNFEPLKVSVPDINIGLNYGKHFVEIDKTIQDRLTENSKGLFMFHGNPGTGKTTYIKYLANTIKRDFIFIPTTMIESFTSDPNCLQYLLKKPKSVLILEDAEKAIVKRYGDNMDSSQVSALLNLTDGILSDMLQISVILTYNCPKNEIDSALKRKGRLQVDYEFKKLSVDDAKNLAKSLKFKTSLIESITSPMTLSDVYNMGKDVEFKNDLVEEEVERIVGFGK